MVIEPGSRWLQKPLDNEGPDPFTPPLVVTVEAVKDGWVKYRMAGVVAPWTRPVGSFLKLYELYEGASDD
jgi:hypothetical protein